MDSRLLAIPTRQGVPTDIQKGIKEYIDETYQQNSSQFAHDSFKLQGLRDAAITAINDQGDIAPILTYYGQLGVVAPKFPNNLNCKLEWGRGLGYGSGSVQSNSLQFDRLNVGYDAAARYSHIGTAAYSKDLAKAYKCFQLAAGALQPLVQTEIAKLPHAPPIGLDVNSMQCVLALCLAQAQECFWANAKSTSQAIKGATLAKLAQGVSFFYSQAVVWADRTSAVTHDWLHHLPAKRDHFAAIALYRWSQFCLEKGKYGEEIARLTAARDLLASTLANEKNLDPLVVGNLKGLYAQVVSDLKRAEKDNDLIYLQDVPSHLDAIPKQIVASAVDPYDPAETAAAEHPLFQLLLPFPIFQAPQAYKEKLTAFVETYIIQELTKLNEKTAADLKSMGLPDKLEEVQNTPGVPPFILDQHEAIARMGGMTRIEQARQQIAKIRDRDHWQLDQAREELDTIQPSIGPEYDRLYRKYVQLKDYLDLAATSDETVSKRLSQVQNLIVVLERGPAEIFRFLPAPPTVQTDRGLAISCSNLRAAAGSLQGFCTQRYDYSERLLAKIDSLDIMTPVMQFINTSDPPVTRASDLEPVYLDLVAQFDDGLVYVKQQKDEYTKLIAHVRERNDEFVAELCNAGSGSEDRQQAIKALEVAGHKFKEVVSNLDEGKHFYESLWKEISSFLAEVREAGVQARIQGLALDSQSKARESFSRPEPQSPAVSSHGNVGNSGAGNSSTDSPAHGVAHSSTHSSPGPAHSPGPDRPFEPAQPSPVLPPAEPSSAQPPAQPPAQPSLPRAPAQPSLPQTVAQPEPPQPISYAEPVRPKPHSLAPPVVLPRESGQWQPPRLPMPKRPVHSAHSPEPTPVEPPEARAPTPQRRIPGQWDPSMPVKFG